MTYAFRLSSAAHTVARFRHALLSRILAFRLSLLGKGLACSLLVCAGPLWASFTIRFNGVVTIVDTGSLILGNPGNVAADSSGNVYISDTGNNRILEVASTGATSPLTITGLSPALSSPSSLALDGAGNLYIADSGNARVVKVASSGSASVVSTPSITLNSPKGVAVDTSGDLFIADTGNNRIVKVTSGGVASVFAITGLGTPLNTPLGLALDPAGSLYIADSVNSRIVRVLAGGTAGTVLGSNGVTLTTPAGLAADNFGHLYVVDTTNPQIIVITTSNGFASLVNAGAVTLSQPRGVAVDPSGILYAANTANNQVISVATTSVGYGHSALATSSGKVLTLPFTVGTNATVGGVKVFTSGTQNLDFTLQGTNSCTPGTTGNVACSVDVQFLPTAPGLRRGALVVYDNSSPQVPLIIVPLYGIADAAQAAISPGPAQVINTGAVPTALPFQLALDGAGDIYSANYSSGNVAKIPPGGSASLVAIGALSPALSNVTGLALDGAGDLFLGDHTNSRIDIVAANGYTSILNIYGLATGLNLPTGIFIDGAGNLYISDWQNNRVVKITQLLVAQNSSQSSSGTGFVVTPGSYTFTALSITGVAVDGQGTVYFADRNDNRVVKVTSAGAASLVVTTPFTLDNPQGVSVDGMGNLYIADSDNARIVQVTTAGIASVVTFTGSVGSLSGPFGVTVDPFGNVLIPDWTNNRIVEVNISGATLTFPSTDVNAASVAQTASVTNLGDDPLVFSANPSYTANFSNNAADTNPCTSSTPLSAGGECDVSINFTPQTGGSLSTNIALTNNTLNVPASTQLVAVSGTGIFVGDTTSTAVTVTPSPLTNGQLTTLTATLADSAEGNSATHPTGTVSFIDTVGSTVLSLGSATLSGGVGTKTGVQLSGIGSHTITASYAGVAGSFLASSGTATVALSKAPVTLAGPVTQPVLVTVGQASSATITVSGPYTNLTAPTGALAYSILNSSSVSVASGALTLPAGSRSSTVTTPIPSTLPSGAYTISGNYGGDSNYLPSSAPVTIAVTVSTIAPVITWNPSATSIIYGTSLGGILDATASNADSTVAGAFAYTAASGGSPFAVLAGTILSAGTYTLTATFTPSNTTTYAVVHSSITLVVTKASATISWNPAATSIIYGAGLGGILDATASNGDSTVAGAFAYTATASGGSPVAVVAGTILAGGTYTLTATFTPTDTTNFAAAPSSITLAVTKATATISWNPGATSIIYGAGLSSILNATASNEGSVVAGTFAYTATASGGSPFAVVAGTILSAGTYTLTATFSPLNGASYATAPSNLRLTVSKGVAAIGLTSTSSTVAPGSPIVFTATASSTVGTPTGSVAFYDGTTLLATIALSGGAAAYSTSSLAPGVHSITATYSGDNNFAGGPSSAFVETVQDFDLTLAPTSPGGGTQTAVPGGTATYQLALGPSSGPTFPAAISLSVSGLPPGATATISPQVLAAGSGTTNVTLTIVLAKTTAALGGDGLSRRLGPMLLGILLLPFAVRIRRAGPRLGRKLCAVLVVMAGCGLVAGLSGCGSTGSGFFGQPQQTYSVIVTGTSGSISHATTVVLIVQ